MNNRENLKSYDEVEKVQGEFSDEDLQKYMSLKLQSAESNVKFINNYVYKGNGLNVCEIGSGNSKLLYQLEMKNILRASGESVGG